MQIEDGLLFALTALLLLILVVIGCTWLNRARSSEELEENSAPGEQYESFRTATRTHLDNPLLRRESSAFLRLYTEAGMLQAAFYSSEIRRAGRVFFTVRLQKKQLTVKILKVTQVDARTAGQERNILIYVLLKPFDRFVGRTRVLSSVPEYTFEEEISTELNNLQLKSIEERSARLLFVLSEDLGDTFEDFGVVTVPITDRLLQSDFEWRDVELSTNV